ncbi:hypothetical protein [Cyanophage S-TIM54]|nr:hypothetical protein [Cyanophage S-TIM54]
MAINYTFNIGSVKKRLTEGAFSDVIIEANFGVQAQSDAVFTGTEEGGDLVVTQPSFSYSCGGSRTFSVDGLTAENFVPFTDVTKDTIKGWLLASEGVTEVEEFSYVKSSIENIAKRIYEYSLEVPAEVGGTDPSGASTYTYTPPAPVEETTPE